MICGTHVCHAAVLVVVAASAWNPRFAVAAAPGVTVGPEIVVANEGPGGAVRGEPTVAFGAGTWLCVWREGWQGVDGRARIVGRRFAADGRLLEPRPIDVAPHPDRDAPQEAPCVAFAKDTFLVVWQDFRSGHDYDILAARVSGEGRVLDLRPLVVATGGGNQVLPAVAGDGDGFLVVWQGHVAGDQAFHGYAARVERDGTVGPAAETGIAPQPLVDWNGNSFLVASADVGFWKKSEAALVDATGKPRSARVDVAKRVGVASLAAAPGGGWLLATHRSRPDPWGWGGPGAIRVVHMLADGKVDPTQPDEANTPTGKRLEHTWLDVNGPGRSHWPFGQTATVWDGRRWIVVWTRFECVGEKQSTLAGGDLVVVTVEGWKRTADAPTSVACEAAAEVEPALASDGDGRALCVYEKRAHGRTVIAARVLRSEEAAGGAEVTMRRALTAADLYGGVQARKVVHDAAAGCVTLDPRVFAAGRERSGVLVTEVLDVGPTAGRIAIPAEIRCVTVAVDADVPAGATIGVEARRGDSAFDQSAWTPWVRLDEEAAGVLPGSPGRYMQVRLTLAGPDATTLPAVRGLTVESVATARVAVPPHVAVKEAAIRRLVTSPIDFRYERPDQEKLVRFRQATGLDAVVAGGTTDFDKLVRLQDWVASCKNTRHGMAGWCPWDIEKVATLPAGAGPGNPAKPEIHGHCMSYAQVMVVAASALGFKARHMAVSGFRLMSHEVVEVWVPSLRKWVYFDPSLANSYVAKGGGEPLSLIELHDIVARNFVPDGKDMNWFTEQHSAETRAVVKQVGGRTPVDARLGGWSYGAPMPPDYDWGWFHGYLADGFVQMTPRNDFHAHPEANPGRFGDYPGYADYPFWVDEKTPPRADVDNWFTRLRDFYWTVDEATLQLRATDDPAVLELDFGHCMPFFKSYRVTVDHAPAAIAATPFSWRLRPGLNRLEVAPVDEFGRVGAASSVVIMLGE